MDEQPTDLERMESRPTFEDVFTDKLRQRLNENRRRQGV